MSTVPFIFAGNTGNIPLSQLDANFANAKSAADFVIANNQANITSVGTLTGLSVNGNILGNGAVSITGNTTIGNNLSVVGTITGAGNTIHGNIFTTGLITATGNITGGNMLTGGSVSATGNILTDGLVSATGNVTGGNIFSAGLVSVTGNVTGGNIFSAGLVSATGNVIASTLNAVDINLSGNIVVEGNATVNGTTTTINVQTLNIADKDVVVANNVSTSALINGAGILAGNPTVASIVYSDAIKGWTTANNFSVGSNLIVTGTTTLTGIPTAPTAANTVADTQIATTAFVRNIVPTGVITLWYGAIVNIPSGWLLCDGTNETPDLRDRFIVGAGTTYAVAATGGSANATLVSHTHTATVTDPGHNHLSNATGLVNNNINFTGTGGANYRNVNDTQTGSAFTGITVANSTEGVSATNANLPPYYALAYIMKA
jgi:hypothetical protein